MEKEIVTKVSNRLLSRKMNVTGMDVVSLVMMEVEKEKINGSIKSNVAQEAIKTIVSTDLLPEKINKDLKGFIESDLLNDIFKIVIDASKGFIKLNLHKKLCGLF